MATSIASLLASPTIMPMQDIVSPAQPFTWGAGGARLTQADIDRRRKIADAQTMGDYSPVGHWTQGLGRALDGLLGGIEERRLDKEQAGLNADRSSSIAALLGGGNEDLAGAFASGDPVLSALAGNVFDVRNRKPAAPHYWETNNGSLGMIGPDGSPQIVYDDPTPKIVWIQAKDPNTGQITLYPMQQGGGGPVSSGMGASVPSGSPLQGWPPPEAISELMRSPGTASQFDEVFGAGAAAKILGKR